ncbi:5-hydroxytryptamine receptor 1B-like [Paramacrobiotus metropolitanus]|uniref:5-hydroxytryptamine receptor 1B-like n=1 Tax=Paramacrobiotus metropolitanus TaxID=2943436 RepID=UPI0024455EB3|nr:5-hydroxytryptamine receptor 1B-like [Paramacrobiotus metropolitanus]
MTAAICLNAGITIYHLLSPSQLTSFSIYLVALYLANIVYCAVVTTMEITGDLYGTWWMGHPLCIFYNYFEYIASLAAVMFHALIAINRIWAISHPVSYRLYHNKKIAGLLCLASLFYVHFLELPGLIMDALYYHLPEEDHGCHINTVAMPVWGWIEHVFCRLLPLVLVVFTFVYTNAVIWYRRRRRANLVTAPPNGSDGNPNSANSIPAKGRGGQMAAASGNQKREVKASLVLTMNAISVLVCWLPADILFDGYLFFGIAFSNTAFTTVMLLYSMQSVFDPLMLLISLRKIK